MLSFSESVKICLTQKYATMSGRATRAEYWWFQLFIWSVLTVLFMLASALGRDGETVPLAIAGIFYLLTLIPNLCVCVRRLHDRGHSGAYFWWCILGWAFGLLIINITNMFPSKDDNEYGPNPFKPIKEVDNIGQEEISSEVIVHKQENSEIVEETKTEESAIDLTENHSSETMFCKHCGREIETDSSFCKYCGRNQ